MKKILFLLLIWISLNAMDHHDLVQESEYVCINIGTEECCNERTTVRNQFIKQVGIATLLSSIISAAVSLAVHYS